MMFVFIDIIVHIEQIQIPNQLEKKKMPDTCLYDVSVGHLLTWYMLSCLRDGAFLVPASAP